MSRRHLWLAAAVASAALCVLWAFMWPRDLAAASTGLRFLATRWGHAAAWLCLSVGSFIRFLKPEAPKVASSAFSLGGLVYLAFIVATYIAR